MAVFPAWPIDYSACFFFKLFARPSVPSPNQRHASPVASFPYAQLSLRASSHRTRLYSPTTMQDVQLLSGVDPNHKDTLEISRRLRTARGPLRKAQQDLQAAHVPYAEHIPYQSAGRWRYYLH